MKIITGELLPDRLIRPQRVLSGPIGTSFTKRMPLFQTGVVILFLPNTLKIGELWYKKMETLLSDFSEITLEVMGFPEDWEKHKVWQEGN